MILRFLFGLVAVLLLLVGIVVVAPGLIPVSAYKGRLEAAASQALGRKVTIGGDITLKIVPNTAFRVADLVVADAEGFPGPYLARVDVAEIGVKLAPLFRREVEIERFVLTRPEFRLVKAADGRVNWNLAQSGAQDGVGVGPQIRDVRLGDVRLVDGKARFTDEQAKKSYALDAVNATVRLASLKEPLEIDGTMNVEGAPSRAKIILNSLSTLLAGEPAAMKLDMALGQTTATADLSVTTKDALAWSGPLKLDVPNLPAFAKLAGAPMQKGAGFDSLRVEGAAKGTDKTLSLADAVINFDKIDATGDLALDWSGPRMKATGALAAGALDLRPYLPPPPPPGSAFPAWSTEKIDLASLRSLDAAIDVDAKKIFLNGMAFDQSRLRLTIEDGRLVADIPSLGMYGGVASGQLVVNVRAAVPTFTGAFDATKVIAERFAVDVLRNDRLLGVGGFKFQFSANGSNQAQIMRSLDGKGGFDLADGAIRGVNLVKLARTVDEIRRGGFNPLALTQAVAAAQAPNEKTDYSEFLSAFTINDGVLTTSAISLKGPFLTMGGAGTVNLAGQRLDVRLAPKATTTATGQGGYTISIPLKVGGTFAKPTMGVDAETLLRGRIEQGIGDFLGKALGRDKAGDAGGATGARSVLDGILGPGGPEPTKSDGTAPAARPEDAVAKGIADKIFGRKRPAEEDAPKDPATAPN